MPFKVIQDKFLLLQASRVLIYYDSSLPTKPTIENGTKVFFWCLHYNMATVFNNAYCSHLVVPSEMRSVIESGKFLLVEIEALHPKHNSRIPDHSNDWNQVWNTSSTDRDPVPGIRNPQFEM